MRFFVAMLWAPLAARFVFPAEETIAGENRRAAALPGLQLSAGGLKAFPRQFEAYFQDRLPYRQRVLALHNQFKIDALGASPSPNIIIGKEGHLYYTDFPPGQDRQALQPFSAAELKEWRDLFQARHDALAKHGIHYLVVLAPDKQTIYPDFLPGAVAPGTPKQSRFDELLLHMRIFDRLVSRSCARLAKAARPKRSTTEPIAIGTPPAATSAMGRS